jgi:hypothetical protein
MGEINMGEINMGEIDERSVMAARAST